MRILILTSRHPTQVALSNKMASASPDAEVVAIVVSRNIPRKSPPPKERRRILLNRIQNRLVGAPFTRAWAAMTRRYGELYPEFPRPAELVEVDNVNDPGTLKAIERHEPDLVVVSATNLVGRKVIAASSRRLGVVNLHTGISPYVKGAPDCTNWCLAERTFELIGNTVMWLDAGVDTGAIISTERTPLDGGESLDEMRWKVMEHAQDLYVRAVRALAEGRPVPRVPQPEIGEGKTYRFVEWDARAMLRARANYRRFYSKSTFQSREFAERVGAIRLVALDEALAEGRRVERLPS